MKSNILILLITLSFLSCKDEKQENRSINGVWESIGSGWVLQIQDGARYTFYDITSISCLPTREAELSELMPALSLEKDTLYYQNGVMTYKFVRSEKMPDLCGTEVSEAKKKDLLYNFEVFSETVKEHYTFMELNNIDWPTLYAQQKSKLKENATEVDLYYVLEETLELLNDNHAFLEASDALYETMEALETEEDLDDTDLNLPEYGDFQIADMVAKHHFIEDLTKDSWLIKWGKMEDNIGYIQVKAMWLYADLEMPKPLIEELGYVDAYVKTFNEMYHGDYVAKEVAAVQKKMDEVMADLMDSKYIVVDIRFNGGGQDAVNFEILRRFNPEKQKIVETKIKHGNGFSPTLPLYLAPASPAYTKPVFVLTSQQTGSAAEAFAIGSMALSHLKRIGSPSQGALSTALEKTLPNGWAFSISNEIYMDLNGNSYENIGVPVNYSLNYPEDRQTFFRSVADDLEGDKRKTLEAMERLLNE